MWFLFVVLLLLLDTTVLEGACVDHNVQTSPLYILEAVDGDTLRLHVTGLPDPLGSELLLRLHGIDAPELFKPKCVAEARHAHEAHAFVRSLLNEATHVRLCSWDKYGGRVQGDVILLRGGGGALLSQRLVQEGWALPWSGRGPHPDWCGLLADDDDVGTTCSSA